MAPTLDIPGSRRRTVAVGLLAAAVAVVVVAAGVPLWLAHQHYDTALEDLGQRLERFERLSESRPALEQKLEGVKAQGSRRFFLKATASSLAAAEVQEQVRRIIETGGARVTSVQVAQPRDEGGFRQFGVSAQFSANIAALRRVLVAVDSSEPYLLVDTLTVRSQVPPNFKPPPGFEPEMYVQLDVAGFAVKGAAP